MQSFSVMRFYVEIAMILLCFDFIFSTIVPPPYTERDPSTESSKDEVNIAAPEAVSPFPKRSEIHLRYQPLAAPQQTMHVC